jgi:hypothetical protein
MLNILPIVMAVPVLPRGAESIQQMVVNGDAIFGAILAPCKIFSAVFIVLQAIAFFSDGGLSNIEKMTENIGKVIWAVIIVSMISGTGLPARAFGIYNYAVMVAVDKSIGTAIDGLRIISKIAKDAPNDESIMREVNRKADNCRRIPPTIYNAENPIGITNPAFTECEQDLKAYIRTESVNVKNAEAKKSLIDTLNPLATINKFFDDIDRVASNAINSTVGAAFEMIFNGWVFATGYAADQAVLVSLLAMPIPLTMSLFNPEPLKVWFSSLWAVGIFKICMTILTKSVLYLNGIYLFQNQQFTQSILLAIFAPAIAGLMAAGGGIGVMKALGDVAGKTAQLVSKVAVKSITGA